MSDGAPSGPTKLHRAMAEAFAAGWRRRVADDPHESDPEQLAAFAEDRLTPGEETQVAREIAASPAALEILASLVDDASLWRRLPVNRAESPADAPPATLRMAPTPAASGRDRRRTRFAAWAMAASLAIAAWGVTMNRRARVQLADATTAQQRAEAVATAVLAAEKARIAELAQAERSPYIVGRSSREWSALASAAVSQGLTRGGTRGGSDVTGEESAAIAAAQDRLLATAQEFHLPGLPGRIEYAAALIQAGRLDDAEDVLQETQAAARRDQAMLGQWRNLRGTLLAYRAAEAPLTAAEPMLAEAEQLFRRAAEGGLAEAWLNLALVLLEQGKTAEATAAQQQYRAGVEVNRTGE